MSQIDDILEWIDNLKLYKRKISLNRNISAAIADGVIIAEIIHTIYPKLIQVILLLFSYFLLNFFFFSFSYLID